MSAFDIIKNMSKQGNTIVGAGTYSAVLSSKDRNKVVKVGTDLRDPWLSYYQLFINLKNNPHTPKVYSLTLNIPENYYVCVMEKLEELESKSDKNLADLSTNFVEGYITDSDFIESAPNHTNLLDLLKLIKINKDIYYVDIDMHIKNFMRRDNTLVIIDPWKDYDLSHIVDVQEWAEHEKLY